MIMTEYKTFAPIENDGITAFKQIKDSSEVNLKYSNTKVPPKALFLKQTETFFTFTPGKSGKIDPLDISNEKKAIFGIRPCDAKSFSILDYVFNGDYKDPYYLTKRENTILVGLSCVHPGVNCFCTSFNDSPSSPDNLDVLLTDIGDNYYIEAPSEKGKHLMKTLNKVLKPATANDEKKKIETEKKAIAIISRNMKTDGIADKLGKVFEHTYWKTLSLKCLGCGNCTYLCPTCHCFDIQDENTLSKGARIRVWDTCMNPEYTVQASGYNPRPERMNRTRNRVYHKYNYFPNNFDIIACVGCGRCITNCPVNIDIINIINEIGEVKP